MSKIEKWLGHTFQSSCQTTDEFRRFTTNFKSALKELVGPEFTIAAFSRGHFEISGFLKQESTQKLIYFSISDVRYWPDKWYTDVLYRTAKSTKDFSGGFNNYCRLNDLKESMERLLRFSDSQKSA